MVRKCFFSMVILIILVPIVCFSEESGNDLIDAAWRGDIVTVERLLNKGVNPNSRTTIGQTALDSASLKGHIEVVKLLIERGANVNATNNDGGTALMSAAWGGYAGVVKLLLSKGASPNMTAKSSTGTVTALSQAKIRGHDEIVQILKKAGARK